MRDMRNQGGGATSEAWSAATCGRTMVGQDNKSVHVSP